MGKLTTVAENESKDFVKDFVLTPVKAEIRFPAVLYALGKADWTGALVGISTGIGFLFAPDTMIDKVIK